MGNCLKTQLKDVVSDNSITRYGELRVQILQGSGEFAFKIRALGIPSTEKLRTTGNITFSDDTTEKSFVDDTVYRIKGTSGLLFLPMKYRFWQIQYQNDGNKERGAFTTEDVQYCTLSSINIPGAINVTGDIKYLGKYTDLTQAYLYETGITGSIEGLVAMFQASGKTTGSITMTLGGTTNVTYQNVRVTSNASKTYTWDSEGNISVT